MIADTEQSDFIPLMAIMTGIARTSPVIRSGRERRGGESRARGGDREEERERTPFQLFHFLAVVYLLLLRGKQRERERQVGNVFIISATKIIWEMTFSA